MRHKVQGVHQLAQALRDFKSGRPIRAVDENGEIRKRADGSGDLIVTDFYLREEFPPPGKVRARSAGITPSELLKNRLADFSQALVQLEEAFTTIGMVTGHDGTSLVEADGVDSQLCDTWRKTLSRIGDDLSFWGRTFRQRHRNNVPTYGEDIDDEGDSPDAFESEVDDMYGSSYEEWAADDRSANDAGELSDSARF